MRNSGQPGSGKLLLANLMQGGASRDGPEVVQATSIRYLETAHGPLLAVSSLSGTQIYNEDATALSFYAPINDPAPDGDTIKQHQAACFVAPLQHIVIGTSKGSLLAVQVHSREQLIALPESFPEGVASGVVDVCFSAVTNTVVSAHHSGELRVWLADAAGQYSNANVVGSVGEVPVRIVSLGARLLVAYGAGTLCLFDAITLELQAEVTAHARWITAVDANEELGFVATVGEDTVLNVWQVDAGTGHVGLQHSSVVTSKLLTGVALPATGGVVVTAYDSSDLYHVGL